MAYPEAFRRRGIGLGDQNMCPNKRKSDAKQHKIFNIFNVNASAPSRTFNVSNTHKNIELKTLCMSVSANLVCLNISQSVACIN